MSVIEQVTAVQGCPLEGAPLYTDIFIATLRNLPSTLRYGIDSYMPSCR